MATHPNIAPIPEEFSVVEVNTFLQIYDHALTANPGHQNFRELFATTNNPHTTVLNRLGGLLGVLFPPKTKGIPDSVGERLKLLFHEEVAGDGLRPTALAHAVRNRLRLLSGYLADLCEEARSHIPGHATANIVRLGATQVLANRLLAYAFSRLPPHPVLANINLKVSIDSTMRLLPHLNLGSLDAIISYGYRSPHTSKKRRVYRDPEVPWVHFTPLGLQLGMILIHHPNQPLRFYENQTTNDVAVDPLHINFRETTLVSIPFWRQGQAMQDLVERARSYGHLHEVSTYDEALAIVRMGGGVALVPEMFQERRIVAHRPLKNAALYARELGVYYRNIPDESPQQLCISANTCRCLEFIVEYLAVYGASETRSVLPFAETTSHPDKKTKAANTAYQKVIDQFARKYGTMSERDWVKLSLETYPPADPKDPERYVFDLSQVG